MLANISASENYDQSADPWQVDAAAFPRNGTAIEKLRFFLRYAVLAPSNHNSQPWAVRIARDHIDLLADRSRSLPISDPFDRELIISCGAFLAFFEIAARAFGCLLSIERFPDRANQDVLARIWLKRYDPGSPNLPLLDDILARRTNRHAFDSAPVTNEEQELLSFAAGSDRARITWITDGTEKASLAQIIMDADKAQFDNPSFLRELASWLRLPKTSAMDGIPSTSIGISGLTAIYIGPLLVRTFDVGQGKAARDQELINNSAAFAIFSTPFDTERDWLFCGEALGSFLLCAQRIGLRVSYLNQPCEVDNTRFRLAMLGSMKSNPQLVLRLGRTEFSPPPTPRRRLV